MTGAEIGDAKRTATRILTGAEADSPAGRFWGKAALSILALVAFNGALFHDALSAGRLFGSDIRFEFLANRAFGFRALASGELPLWNPYIFCGYPFVGSLQSALFYPPNALFLWLPVQTAFAWSAFVHLLLAGFIMHVFVVRETRSATSGLFAGLVASGAPGILSRIYAGHVTIYTGYPWLILSLLSSHVALRKGSVRASVVSGATLALQILAGHPSMPACAVIGIVLDAVMFLVSRRDGASRILVLRMIAVTGAFALGLGAVQIVPTAQLAFESRRAWGVDYEYATSFSFPPEGLATLIAPGFFGDHAESVYWGRWFLWEYIPYIGLLPLLFLFLSVRLGDPRIRAFVMVAVGAMALAFGRYVRYYRFFFATFPLFNILRGPGRMMLLFVVSAAAASGLVFFSLVEAPREVARRGATIAFGLAVVVALLLVVLLTEPGRQNSDAWITFVSLLANNADRIEPPDVSAPRIYALAFAQACRSLAVSFAGLLAATAVFVAAYRCGWTRRIRLTAILLLATDLFIAGRVYVRSTPPYPEGLPPDVVAALGPRVPPARIASASTIVDANVAGLDGISHVGGYDPALPTRYREYVNQMEGRNPDEEIVVSEPIRPGGMLRLMGITHVVTTLKRMPYPGARLIHEGESRKVYEIEDPIPRAFIVHRARVISDRDARLRELADPSFDPRREVLLEEGMTDEAGREGMIEGEEVRFVKYGGNEVALRTRLAQPGWLILTDAFSAEWRVIVDGGPAEVLPANHLFRAVALDPGVHDVVFYYRKSPVVIGGMISLATLILAAAVLLAGRGVPKDRVIAA